jgi:ubiquinone/menaquinone biosynthesis C-methylase UbiE
MDKSPVSPADVLSAYDPVYRERYETLQQTLTPLAKHIRSRGILDFGCGKGMSACVALELGAASVIGVDVFASNMEGGPRLLAATGYADRITLVQVADTSNLPFESGAFDTVICNAVIEHIPQPRGRHIRELWRMVRPGGVLIINETPNKYLPFDFHTLHLPLTNWLPAGPAHWIGVRTGRFAAARTDWAYSGWRGLGHYELARNLRGQFSQEPELTRVRHRVLNRLGLPSGLLDPYPLYVLRKHIGAAKGRQPSRLSSGA